MAGAVTEVPVLGRREGAFLVPYEQQKIQLPENRGIYRDLLLGEGRARLSAQDTGVLRYQADMPGWRNGVQYLPADLASEELTDAFPLSRFPMERSAREAQVLTALLRERQLLSMATTPLFADDSMQKEVPVTLPQLTASPNAIEQASNLSDDGLGSHTKVTSRRSMNIETPNFQELAKTSVTFPYAFNSGLPIEQPHKFDKAQVTAPLSLPLSLNPTKRKQARIIARRGQTDYSLNSIPVPVRTNTAKDVSDYKLDLRQGRDLKVQKDLDWGSRLRNGKKVYDANLNEGAAPSPTQQRRMKLIRADGQVFEQPEAGKPLQLPWPRLQVEGTLAEGHLSPEWQNKFMTNVAAAPPWDIRPVQEVLQGETLRRTKYAFKKYPAILQSPIMAIDFMPDGIAGTIRPNPYSESGWEIWVNGRVWIDPEDLIFIIVEEAMHIARRLAGRPFDTNAPYEQRLHEITAKKGALYISGRPGQSYQHYIARPIGHIPTIEDY